MKIWFSSTYREFLEKGLFCINLKWTSHVIFYLVTQTPHLCEKLIWIKFSLIPNYLLIFIVIAEDKLDVFGVVRQSRLQLQVVCRTKGFLSKGENFSNQRLLLVRVSTQLSHCHTSLDRLPGGHNVKWIHRPLSLVCLIQNLDQLAVWTE